MEKTEKENNFKNHSKPLISVIMGSKSDFETMQVCLVKLDELEIPYEAKVVSAHRTPQYMFDYSLDAEKKGIKIIIAAAGGAAHLPGMVASICNLPVIGVPIKSKVLKGIDSLLSIVQMPSGVPVATVAIGEAGAENSAILACKILAINNDFYKNKLIKMKEQKQQEVLSQKLF